MPGTLCRQFPKYINQKRQENMNYSQRLQNVAVLGAAGKMGSGIVLLTAVEMQDQGLLPENKGKTFTLHAIDMTYESLNGLLNYLRVQVLKLAEKRIVALRQLYSDREDLIENGQIVEQYVQDVLMLVKPSVSIEPAYQAHIVFEAIKEDPELKIRIFSQINQNNPLKPWFLTNTSSIPIRKLDAGAGLEGRVIGFHFYNPPAIQKLVELIKAPETTSDIETFSKQYAKNIKKVVVPSHDVAGFIGNGHFMRDALYGLNLLEKLQSGFSFTESLYLVNKISQEFLIRPMGIFQLIDYVGIDVCQYILSVMQSYMNDEVLHHPMLDKMIAIGVKGGQNADGSQKDGFLKYEKGKPVAVFDPEKNTYILFETFKQKMDESAGKHPENLLPWKSVIADKSKETYLRAYFSNLKAMETFGAKLAVDYHLHSKSVAEKLVSSGVALKPDDVNTVLMTGFFHAYGPINDYI
jgi:3-hydroxyacyl-CoA dehydrogenase